jgi:rubrerythrin
MTKDEALKMAIEAMDWELGGEPLPTLMIEARNACKEALERPSNMVAVPVDKLQDMQRRLKALEQPTEPRLVSYAPDGSTCTLNIDGEEVYFNREQPKLTDEKGKPMTYWGGLEQPAQDYVLICKRCGDDLGIEYVPDEKPKMTYEQGFAHGYEAHRAEQGCLACVTCGELAQEPVAWMKSALDNARDVCKYLDHDMVKEAKAHTQFFWNDLDKIKEFEDALSNSDTI